MTSYGFGTMISTVVARSMHVYTYRRYVEGSFDDLC